MGVVGFGDAQFGIEKDTIEAGGALRIMALPHGFKDLFFEVLSIVVLDKIVAAHALAISTLGKEGALG
jgi:hypothetical protein